MARPKKVYLKSLPKFTEMLTRKVKMMSGVELTALHLLKETPDYYVSIESWAFCCSTFKKMKHLADLKVEIPTVNDRRTISFLNLHAWHDWVDREINDKGTDMIETVGFLDRLFPDKKKVFFYEMDTIISSFCFGNFISYDNDGNVEARSEHSEEKIGYLNNKYYGRFDDSEIVYPKEVKILKQKYRDEKNDNAATIAYKAYRKASDKFLRENHDLSDIFLGIGQNAVVCPYIYTKPTLFDYAHAGEIYFVVTPDTVYFCIGRHY